MKQNVLVDEVIAVAGAVVAVFVVLCVHQQLDNVFGGDERLFFLRRYNGYVSLRENVVVVTAQLGHVTPAIHPLNIHANGRTSILPDRIHRNDRDSSESRPLLKNNFS